MRAIPQLNPEETGSSFETPTTNNDDYCLQRSASQTSPTTYPEQVPATLKSSLLSEEGQDVPYIRALPCEMTLQLVLLPDKRLELGFARLNIRPSLPTTLDKSIQ